MSRHHRVRVSLVTIAWLCASALGCSSDAKQNGAAASGAGSGASGAGAGSGAAAGNGAAAGSSSSAKDGGTVGSAGTHATAGTSGGTGSTQGDAGLPMGKPLAMNECGLHTKYPGDEYCIKPPPPDKGFQVHIGPSNYDSPEAQYLLQPSQEATSDYPAVSGNDKKIYFYYRQYRMRPGAHHNIVTNTSMGGGFGMGNRIATSNLLAEDSPAGGVIAPENKGVGIPLEAGSKLNVSLHSINTSSKTELRELWINFWYRDPAEVTQPVQQMFQTGSVTFAVQPHADTMLGPFQCKPTGDGRMLWFYGHRHANNVRFSAWRIRGSQRDLFYEAYNWEDPLVLEYSSTAKNAVADRANMVEGGWTGVLDIKAGDTLEWECHVVNKTDGVLHFTNNTFTGEMCIMDAELVGTNCP